MILTFTTRHPELVSGPYSERRYIKMLKQVQHDESSGGEEAK